MIRLIRRWLQTSPPITDISVEQVSVQLQGLRNEGQFAVFNLPRPKCFAQVKRTAGGGLHLEVSQRTPEIEALLRTLGDVTFIEGYGFPAVTTAAGDDSRASGVVARALSLLAANHSCPNVTRIQTGKG